MTWISLASRNLRPGSVRSLVSPSEGGLGYTQGKTSSLAARRPALVSARAWRLGVRVPRVTEKNLETEERTVVGVLRENPGSSRRRGRPRRHFLCRRTLAGRQEVGSTGVAVFVPMRVVVIAYRWTQETGVYLASCCCGISERT